MIDASEVRLFPSNNDRSHLGISFSPAKSTRTKSSNFKSPIAKGMFKKLIIIYQ